MTDTNLPNIYRPEGMSIRLSRQQYEEVKHSNDAKNNQIINNIDDFSLRDEFYKNKYAPLGLLPKLAEYKKKLDSLIFEKFNNPENITARRKIFLNKKRK